VGNLTWILLKFTALCSSERILKIHQELLQSVWFQIQYNAINSATFIELSSCWRTYTTEQSQLQLQTVPGALNHVIQS